MGQVETHFRVVVAWPIMGAALHCTACPASVVAFLVLHSVSTRTRISPQWSMHPVSRRIGESSNPKGGGDQRSEISSHSRGPIGGGECGAWDLGYAAPFGAISTTTIKSKL